MKRVNHPLRRRHLTLLLPPAGRIPGFAELHFHPLHRRRCFLQMEEMHEDTMTGPASILKGLQATSVMGKTRP